MVIADPQFLSEPAPTTRIVMATRSADLQQLVDRTLRDEFTDMCFVEVFGDFDAITPAPDVAIFDAWTVATDSRTILRMRRRWPGISLLALNVGTEIAAAELLAWGVDDAIEARCSWPLVQARLGAVARRTRAANAQLRRRVGDVVYDRENHRVWCRGEEVEFAPRELAMLDCLWMRAGEVVDHDALFDFVWAGEEETPHSNRVEVYISYVRRKLASSEHVVIETVRGIGYRLGLKERR